MASCLEQIVLINSSQQLLKILTQEKICKSKNLLKFSWISALATKVSITYILLCLVVTTYFFSLHGTSVIKMHIAFVDAC